MASLNKVMLIGHLGRDPEPRTFPDGGTVTNVSIATTDRWKDRQTGEQREATEWHNLVFHNRLAEIAAQYLRKGSPVYVEGSLRTRKWQDKNGQDRYTTEIHVNEMKMLGSKGDGARAQGGQYDNSAPYSSPAPATGAHRPAQNLRVVQQPAPANVGGQADAFDSFEDDVPF